MNKEVFTTHDLAWDKDRLTFMAPNTVLRWWYNEVLKPEGYIYRKKGECGRGIYSREGRCVVDMNSDVTIQIGEERCCQVMGGLASDLIQWMNTNNWSEFYKEMFN